LENIEQGLYWLKKAVDDHKSTEAMYQLGRIYYEGRKGLQKTSKEAANYFGMGAELNDPNCQYRMGNPHYLIQYNCYIRRNYVYSKGRGRTGCSKGSWTIE
jgi:TPR repeat protein